jgi:hypothetical protein
MQFWFIVAAALALLVIAYLLWWWVPKWQMRRVTAGDPKARADVEDNFRKTVGQALGGIAVLIGAGAAYYGTLQTLQVNKDQAQRSEQSARDLLISNQVAKGFEQLGSDKIVVRLGRIYALEGVMNTSEQYHQPVLEALSAFVRDSTKDKKDDGQPATDIQAALTVIGRRKAIGTGLPDFDRVHIPTAVLNNANLNSATLWGIHLNNATLIGANLTYATLMNADLTGAVLTFANLSGAILIDAHLNGAILWLTNLTGTNLEGADITGADLRAANLTGANLTRAIISQTQLDEACGTNAILDTGLTLKPCAK